MSHDASLCGIPFNVKEAFTLLNLPKRKILATIAERYEASRRTQARGPFEDILFTGTRFKLFVGKNWRLPKCPAGSKLFPRIKRADPAAWNCLIPYFSPAGGPS
jgi:hypothetical protein